MWIFKMYRSLLTVSVSPGHEDDFTYPERVSNNVITLIPFYVSTFFFNLAAFPIM